MATSRIEFLTRNSAFQEFVKTAEQLRRACSGCILKVREGSFNVNLNP